MRSIFGTVAGVLLLGAATVASAQSMETGTVVRIDPQSKVVILDDGRMYRVTDNTVLVVDNQRAPFTALTPGQRVVIQSGEVVALRGGQYVAVAPGTAVVAPAPAVVAQAPAVVTPAPATAVPMGLRQTFYGTVTDVDKDGEVKIKTQRDSFEIKVGPEALRQIKKGDAVTLDLTIAPPGAPAASPPTR
jgi:preprotein translocase subunit YajC